MAGTEPRARRLLVWPLLVAVCLAAYVPVWHGEPLWDDDAHFTPLALQDLDGLRRIWIDPSVTQQYYPLTHTAFWAMQRLWGYDTTGYHLVCIVLHASSAWLVFLIGGTLGLRGRALAALVFALHPVQVESVAWISELKNTGSTLLYLMAALAWFQFDATRVRRWWAVSLGLFVLALLSKTVTATLPFSLLVVAWWRRGRIDLRRDLWPLAPFVALGLAAGVTTAWVEKTVIGAEGPAFDLSLVDRVLVAGRAVVFYATSVLWPVNLTFVYPRWDVSAAVWWQYLFPAGAGAAVALLWRLRQRSRGPLTAALLFCIALAPALGFVDVYPFLFSYVADHFQYLAMVPAALSIGAAMAWLSARATPGVAPSRVLAAAAVVGLAVLTWRQSHAFASPEVLYQATLARNPRAWLAHQNLGAIRLAEGELDAAMRHSVEALRLYPRNAQASNNLGYAWQLRGDLAQARRAYQVAVSLNPDLVIARVNLSALDLREGRFLEAEAHLRAALAREPDQPEAANQLGRVLLAQGRLDEARRTLEDLVARRPSDPGARTSLAIVLERLNVWDRAREHYEAVVRLAPASGPARDNLGYHLLRAGDPENAIPHFREALRLDSSNHDARASLAAALSESGRHDEALEEYGRALAIPALRASADVRHGHGVALARRGRLPEAAAEFREALRLRPGDEAIRASLERTVRR